MPPPISVTIIAGNEEDRIAEAVRSAAWAAEVVVLDSESRDRTAEVAAAAGARVVVEPWRGYGQQKNRAAALAAHPWVLSLDADERVGAELAAAITQLPAAPDHAAYRVRRRNYLGDAPLRHWPWAWDRTARLYDRRRARFSEREVHETLVADGPVGRLAGVLEHFSYRSWADYWERQDRYARLGARDAARRGRSSHFGDLTVRPALTFVRHYLLRGYLLGGWLGLRFSLAAARGTWLKYRLLSRLRSGGGAG